MSARSRQPPVQGTCKLGRCLPSELRVGASLIVVGAAVGRLRRAGYDRRRPLRATCSTITLAVHPRACGEHTPQPCKHSRSVGSSPRVRGTPKQQRPGGQRPRFIPARAGNAPPDRCRARRCAVHPRACGERRATERRPPLPAGSSPRVRGTPRPGRKASLVLRFIPARAGNAPIPATPGAN